MIKHYHTQGWLWLICLINKKKPTINTKDVSIWVLECWGQRQLWGNSMTVMELNLLHCNCKLFWNLTLTYKLLLPQIELCATVDTDHTGINFGNSVSRLPRLLHKAHYVDWWTSSWDRSLVPKAMWLRPIPHFTTKQNHFYYKYFLYIN